MKNTEKQGTVSAWVAEKGFGFITRGTSSKDFERYWFHITHYCGINVPTVGAQVAFVVKPIMDGPNPTAENVRPI
jgi:cold shock CspA family protein